MKKSINPKVSVITVFLNAERFLCEAVESVLSQSFAEWELLLVDDGSRDRSTEIAKAYSQADARVRYLEHPEHRNRGISASQNLGIDNALGEYIAFLDSDDVWLPHKLQEQLDLLETNPTVAMVYGQTLYWNSWDTSVANAADLLIPTGFGANALVPPPSLLIRILRQEVPAPCPSDAMLRKSAALAVGGFETSFRRIFTDQAFFSKLYVRYPILISGQTWFRYRRHSDSAVSTMKKTSQLQSARLDFLKWLKNYLGNIRPLDRELKRALKFAILQSEHPGLFKLLRALRYRMIVAKEMLKSLARRFLPQSVQRMLRAMLAWNGLRT